MRSLRLFALPLALVLAGANAQAAATRPDQPKANVAIGQGYIDGDAVDSLLAKIGDVQANAGTRGEFSMGEILSFLPLTEGERATVVAAHSEPVPITCDGDICTAVSRGAEVYANLSQLNNIPAYFARTVTLKIRWRGPGTLELCSIKGLQVKQVFWVNVDGVVVTAHGEEGSSFVDVSLGGSFPNC